MSFEIDPSGSGCIGVNPAEPANNLAKACIALGECLIVSLCPIGDINGNKTGAAVPIKILAIFAAPCALPDPPPWPAKILEN